MKTLKYLAFGFAAAFGLVAACGDDTGGADTSSSSNDGGEGGSVLNRSGTEMKKLSERRSRIVRIRFMGV